MMNPNEELPGPNQEQRTYLDIPSIRGASSLHSGVCDHTNRPPWRSGVRRKRISGRMELRVSRAGGGSPSTSVVCVMGPRSD